jgi:hypothetical protein
MAAQRGHLHHAPHTQPLAGGKQRDRRGAVQTVEIPGRASRMMPTQLTTASTPASNGSQSCSAVKAPKSASRQCCGCSSAGRRRLMPMTLQPAPRKARSAWPPINPVAPSINTFIPPPSVISVKTEMFDEIF